jgi:hypothetical protein
VAPEACRADARTCSLVRIVGSGPDQSLFALRLVGAGLLQRDRSGMNGKGQEEVEQRRESGANFWEREATAAEAGAAQLGLQNG